MAEGSDRFHHEVLVRCYVFHILARPEGKYCKKSYSELKLRISPPQSIRLADRKDVSQLLLFHLNKCC